MDGMILLQEARAAGLIVSVEGERLKIRGPRQADPIARKLIAHKSAVVDALQAEERRAVPHAIFPNDLTPEWHFLWDERAAIMEYDGGMTTEHAEAAALNDILQQMRDSGMTFPSST
jgi:hypothetical protein